MYWIKKFCRIYNCRNVLIDMGMLTYNLLLNQYSSLVKLYFELDIGKDVIDINPNYIWGLNFSIRKKVLTKYKDMSGVFNWEYIDSPPIKDDPSEWVKKMREITYSKRKFLGIWGP